MSKVKPKTPQRARTFAEICLMPRDNLTFRNSWILADTEDLTIVNQKVGESPSGKVKLDKATFERFWKFYTTGR